MCSEALVPRRRCGVPHTRVTHKQEFIMAWKSPKIVEIALGAEINSYACAEAKK
jgi:coenzyme PQQ precursor peptide PqqA